MLDFLKNKQQYATISLVIYGLPLPLCTCICMHNSYAHVQSQSLIARILHIPNPKQFAYLHI